MRFFFSSVSILHCGICLSIFANLAIPAVVSAANSSPTQVRPSDWSESTTLVSGWQFVKGDLGGIWETLRSADRAVDLPVWTAVDLPHCFNATDAVDPDVPYYEGPGWYRTDLAINNPHRGGRTLLQFEGAGQKTAVWIGEQKVTEHIGGYDEFTVDITDAVAAYRASALAKLPAADYRVAPGRIPLAVRCDNSRDLESIPSDLSDFNRYGGLYRPVHLVYLPAGGLMRVYANPTRQPDGSWSVSVSGRFNPAAADAAGQTITVRLVDPEGKTIAQSDASVPAGPAASEMKSLATITIPHPELWSPDSPSLYGVEVISRGPDGESRVWERVGLRTFEFVDHGPFKLNGTRLLLQGTHRHEDGAGVAAAETDASMEKEMRLMKSMGVNFIRLAHYQQSRRILELCDELGLIVWEEIPWCRGGLGSQRYQDQAREMLRAMIDQHRNHPAVILWGLGNENDWPGDFSTFDKKRIRAFMSELNTLAHSLDPTRVTVIRRCDFCRDIPDVYSPSIWAGWYRGTFTEYKEVMEKEAKRVKHFIHAEWGGDSLPGRNAEDPYARLRDVKSSGAADERGLDFMGVGGNARVSRDGDWSETYLCDLVDWHLKEQEKMDWLTGSAMWPFKDFSTPLRPDNPIPFVNQKGAVERDLTLKESFYVYQSYWTKVPMIRIYGHAWPVRWGAASEKRLVRIYSNCDEVELWVNGVSQGVKHRNSQDFPAAGLRWQVGFEEGMNQLRAVGRSHGHTVNDEITFRYETRKWGKPDHIRMQELPAPPGRSRVQVELLDAVGVVCLDADNFVRFGYAGDGRLIDNLGTVGGSRKVQLANGRARIDVAIPPGGQASVSAQIDGVSTQFIRLHAPTQVDLEGRKKLAATPAKTRFKEVTEIEKDRIIQLAAVAMKKDPVSLRSVALPAFAAKIGAVPGDFLSMGDYWWPNPDSNDGLPYVRRDGKSNPDNFDVHRQLMREMRDAVASLAGAYLTTHDAAYARRAAEWLRIFFVDPATRMNPNLRFAQAIPGVSNGRGIGIIDTLHLVEIPMAVTAIIGADGVTPATIDGVRAWFADYLHWMLTDANGHDEAATKNNHSVAYTLQVAVFAKFAGDTAALNEARQKFLTVLLPTQLAADGSFPRELNRTKPYGYSIFQLDNVTLLTEILSTPGQDLWQYILPDGRSVAQAVAFLFPYLADRSVWPFTVDVAHFDGWNVRQPALLFAGYRLGQPDYLALWRRLPADPTDLEVRRNLAVTQPLLWLQSGR
ncbi:MAG TPA: alginate lyase family protein [Lacunisphaera sp.]|jgi:beta-galactosidase